MPSSFSVDEIQLKPGRLVAIVSKKYGNGISHEPWGIEATWDIMDWSGNLARSKQVKIADGTMGTDIKGPFLLPDMKKKPGAYPVPFIHLVLLGENTYYIADAFLVDGYLYAKENQKDE